VHDYHVHSNYSDGAFLRRMVDAAADAGVDGVGIADHCNVSPDPSAQRFKRVLGFNLDLTYERRREAIEAVRADPALEIDVYDAVVVDGKNRIPETEPGVVLTPLTDDPEPVPFDEVTDQVLKRGSYIDTLANTLENYLLETSPKPLDEVYERVTEVFFALNDDWRFTYVNPRTEGVLDKTADDLVGRNGWGGVSLGDRRPVLGRVPPRDGGTGTRLL